MWKKRSHLCECFADKKDPFHWRFDNKLHNWSRCDCSASPSETEPSLLLSCFAYCVVNHYPPTLWQKRGSRWGRPRGPEVFIGVTFSRADHPAVWVQIHSWAHKTKEKEILIIPFLDVYDLWGLQAKALSVCSWGASEQREIWANLRAGGLHVWYVHVRVTKNTVRLYAQGLKSALVWVHWCVPLKSWRGQYESEKRTAFTAFQQIDF